MNINSLFASTAQLVKLNEKRLPTGLASGIVLKFNGKTYLLTVGHALVDGISLQLNNDEKGMACWPLGGGRYLLSRSQYCAIANGIPIEKSWDLNDQTIIDAAVFKLPPDCHPVRYIITQGVDATCEPVTLFDIPSAFPRINGECKFCGMVDPQPPDPREPYSVDYRFYFYQRGAAYGSIFHIEDKGCYRYFQIENIDGLNNLVNFQGCSGSPLFDETGNLVAMVCGIDLESRKLKAIDIGTVFPVLSMMLEN